MKLATIATAAGFAGLATLAALALSAVDLVLTESRDNATRAAVDFILHAEPVTLGELHHAPRELREAAWSAAGKRWTAEREALTRASALRINQEHAAATRERADEDDTAAADARLFEFARGIGSHVSEDDLAIGSPAAVAAASARLD